MHLLGVDGGAGSTRAVIGRSDGTLVGVGFGAPSDHLVSDEGKRRLWIALRDAIGSALADAGIAASELEGCWLGMTGVFDAREDGGIVATYAERLTGCGRITVSGDIEPALAGASLGRPGIIVYAGTGSIAYGRDPDGRSAQAGGWGYLVDDRGGGYRIGLAALEAVFRAFDGRGPATTLTAVVLAHYGVAGAVELLRALYRDDRVDRAAIAALAPHVSAAAGAGDGVAGGILDGAAEQLAELAACVAARLPRLSRPPIYYSGGVFEAGAALRLPLERALERRMAFASLRASSLPPVVGSFLLALQERRLPLTEARLANLTASFDALKAAGRFR